MAHRARITRLPAPGLMALAALSWGLATGLSKFALEQMSPLDLVALEVGSGAIIVIALVLILGRPGGRPRAIYLLLGVLDPGLSFVLFDVGISRTAATHAALLLASETLFVVLLARITLGERLSPRLAAAVSAGFGGALLVSLGSGGPAATITGDALILGASVLAAAYGVLARRVAAAGDWLIVTATQLVGAVAICLPFVTVSVATGHSRLSGADAGHVLAALAIGVLATVLPFGLYNAGIARMSAMAAATILSLVPVFATAAVLLLVGGGIGVAQIVGGALVVGAATMAIRLQLATGAAT